MADEGDAVNNLDELEPVHEDDDDEERIQDSDDADGEDLIHDNMQQDYRANSALDHYEEEGLDDEAEGEGYDPAARRAAEAELDRRDGRELPRGAARRRLPAALAEEEEDDEEGRPRRRARRDDGGEEEDADEEEPGDEALGSVELLHANAVKGPLAEWIVQPPVDQQIRRWFRRFLKKYEEAGMYVYRQRIKDMAENNRTSLEVNFPHMAQWSNGGDCGPTVALWTAEQPKLMLAVLSEAAREVVSDPDVFGELAEAWAKSVGSELEVHVRIVALPMMDEIRLLRHHHLNSLVKISGVVTRRTGVFPQLSLVHYDCIKCSYTMGPFAQTGGESDVVKPNACPQCQSKGPFNVNIGETVYRDFQKMTLQESPGTVPAGRLPRQKEVILLHDLIDVARPGEEVEVTGVYGYGYDIGLNIRNSFPVFSTNLEANYISKREDLFSIYALTDDDKATILTLARDPRIGQRIIKSIAPSIYGHDNIKTGLALALFGGQEKYPSPAHRLRGDINILLLGDPGVAKSQFLKYVEKTAMRAIYTTGKGASAVGLTAAVHKDAITKEWTLEGGALVLADKGVCLIDEFDKMNDQDRVSIHEAMEQQSISISKAGIVTSLQARCAVIAAANPVGGRYDPSRTFAENVELSDPILSRFDIMCVIRDQVDPVNDAKLAHFVVGSHARCHPDRDGAIHDPQEQASAMSVDADILPQETLRKYITYAKQSCRPQMQAADYDRIKNVYAELRQAAARTHGMPVAVRHLESIIRMSEAHARMHLRDFVSGDDINIAIKTMVQSFVQTQKHSVQPMLERRFRRYLTCGADFHQLLLSLLRGLLREEQRNVIIQGTVLDGEELYKIPVRNLEEKAREHEIGDLQDFFKSPLFTGNSFQLDATHTTITYHA